MTPVKFIEAVDSYFVYSTEALFTKVHEFIELFRNNNTVLGELAKDTWQPGVDVTTGEIKRTSNMPAGVAAKATAGGETSTTEPTWPTTGTVSDGGVVWKMIPQYGMETATQAEVTTGTDTEKAVTPATAAGCYLKFWQGTTAPTDLSGRTAWLDTSGLSATPATAAVLKYYNTVSKAWESKVAYATAAGTASSATDASTVGGQTPLFAVPDTITIAGVVFTKAATGSGGSLEFRYNQAASATSTITEDASGEIYINAANGVKLASGVLLK